LQSALTIAGYQQAKSLALQSSPGGRLPRQPCVVRYTWWAPVHSTPVRTRDRLLTALGPAKECVS